MNDLEEFRLETRQWLETHCPVSLRTPMSEREVVWGGRNASFPSADAQRWLQAMGDRGWTAPTWPRSYGGGGLTAEQNAVLQEELRRIKARPPLYSFGLWMFGPVLLEFGDEEQKQRFLPPIVRGETRWCQGYSEPGAGSDLASLATRCEDHGEHFLINGQKIWTSYANLADWMFCLVRTNPDAKKQLGISLVLFDMTTPGVSTRPIKLISGSSPFCETFLDNVRVEKSQVVGEINAGWTIAKYLLTHEREMIGGMGRTAAGQKTLPQIAVDAVGLEDGKLADGMLRGELATWDLDAAAFALTAERVLDEAKAGQGVGAASAMLKYYGTELNKRRQELMVALHGSDGLVWEGEASREGAIARTWLRSKGNSIEGGTTEVQLNVIARNILGLQ